MTFAGRRLAIRDCQPSVRGPRISSRNMADEGSFACAALRKQGRRIESDISQLRANESWDRASLMSQSIVGRQRGAGLAEAHMGGYGMSWREYGCGMTGLARMAPTRLRSASSSRSLMSAVSVASASTPDSSSAQSSPRNAFTSVNSASGT